MYFLKKAASNGMEIHPLIRINLDLYEKHR